MTTYSAKDLEEAKTAIHSLLNKCGKALHKTEKGSSQHTLLTRRIRALLISEELIKNEILETKME